jgi:hypothetical protein
MSTKQEIYREILLRVLPWIRNVQTWPWWRRMRERSVRWDAELVHNMPVSLLDPSFTDHDVWFLNVQARSYCEECSVVISPNYEANVSAIRRLFESVPPEKQSQLEWRGPGGVS